MRTIGLVPSEPVKEKELAEEVTPQEIVPKEEALPVKDSKGKSKKEG